MAVLSSGGGDGSRRRDSIILTFEDAKISVLEFDDSIHGLRTRCVVIFCLLFLVFWSMLCQLCLNLIPNWNTPDCFEKYYNC